MHRLIATTLAAVVAACPLSAQATVDLTAGGVGLAIGDVARVTGIRISYTDHQLERVNGLNLTVQGGRSAGTVNGLNLGLLSASTGNTNGVGLGLLSVSASRRLRGIMVSPLVIRGGRIPPRDSTTTGMGIDGAAAAGLVIIGVNHVRGIAVAPFVSTAGRAPQSMDGIVLSGFANSQRVRGAVVGVIGVNATQFTGLAVGGLGVLARESLTGISFAGLGTNTRSMRGFGASLGRARGGQARGILAAGLFASSAHLRGGGVAGFRTSVDTLHGLAFGAVLAQSRQSVTGVAAGTVVLVNRLSGLAVGGLVGGRDVKGIVLAPIGMSIERNGTMQGVSVSAINAIHGTQRGLTIGVLNSARNLHGVQIGLINVAQNNPSGRRVLPLINWHRD